MHRIFLLKALTLSAIFMPFQVSAEYQESQNFKLGVERIGYHYKETSNGSMVMKATGPMIGINAAYTYEDGQDFFIDLDARALTGLEDYDGHLMNLDTGTRTPYSTGYNTRNHIFETRLTPGFKFEGGYHLYAGLGYRLKTDSPIYSNSASYKRQSQYLYLPFGVKVPSKLFEIDTVPYFEYDLFLMGKQVSGATSNLGQSVNRQSNGFGLKTGVAFVIDAFELTPFIHYWHINDSDISWTQYKNGVMPMIEPENTTWEIGIKATYRF